MLVTNNDNDGGITMSGDGPATTEAADGDLSGAHTTLPTAA